MTMSSFSWVVLARRWKLIDVVHRKPVYSIWNEQYKHSYYLLVVKMFCYVEIQSKVVYCHQLVIETWPMFG